MEDSHKILAQQLSDWGADVILGTHPHVVQDAEWKTSVEGRQTFVAYSLGNFLSTQSKPDQLIGAILTLELNKTTDPDGSVHCAVASPQLHPTMMPVNPMSAPTSSRITRRNWHRPTVSGPPTPALG